MLDQVQTAMMEALDHGPGFLPNGLFAGPQLRVLAGMKVHANTVSHARLVALEETFPRTRQLLDHARFNEHSRQFILLPGVTAAPLALIGQGMADYLAQAGEQAAADMARFEWLWLESFHAAEATPLSLADLAGIDPERLLKLALQRHPAARLQRFGGPLREALGHEVPGLRQAAAVLITRPAGQVLVAPATRTMAKVLSLASIPVPLGNLFAALAEPGCKDRTMPDDPMPPLMALLEAGALVGSPPEPVGTGEESQ